MKQGLLGDCWFLCACAALQKSRHLLDQVPVAGRAALLLSSCLLCTGRKQEAGQLSLLLRGLCCGPPARLAGRESSALRPQGLRGVGTVSPCPQGSSAGASCPALPS